MSTQAQDNKESYIIKGRKDVDLREDATILDIIKESCVNFADKKAFISLGHTLTFKDIDKRSDRFAAYIQNYTDLKPGDKIAIQMPNTLMFPVVLFGAMKAGLIVVNTNPLYSEREMEHQFNDSGARAVVVLANMAQKVQHVLPHTNIKHVFVTQIGDMHPMLKRRIINFVVKTIRKGVPKFDLPYAVSFRKALWKGSRHTPVIHQPKPDDIAVLQYTGGTTGVAKGAMLTHRNLVANMLQAGAVVDKLLRVEEDLTVVAPLPLYHIYSFTVNVMITMYTGNASLLIPDPRDGKAMMKELKTNKFDGFVGLNTLFMGLANADAFKQLDFKNLRLTISGGMALTTRAAELWEEVTGCKICEGYGMTETSPITSLNPPNAVQLGSIGTAIPWTDAKVVDDEGNILPFGEAGELCMRGPQVMKGYWNNEAATAEVMDADGFIKTGDVAVIKPDGYITIVDRKKDLVNVSGFNVYPNEIEEVLSKHPDIIEVAVVGVPDDKSGEAVKAFIYTKNKNLDRKEMREWSKSRLTGYKVPKHFEFRDEELPKTNVGKVLRRELRVNNQNTVEETDK